MKRDRPLGSVPFFYHFVGLLLSSPKVMTRFYRFLPCCNEIVIAFSSKEEDFYVQMAYNKYIEQSKQISSIII